MKPVVFAAALIFGLSASGLASAQTPADTFAERLQGVKHISLRFEERLAGYIVRVYTLPQRADDKVAMDKYEVDRKEHLARLEAIEKKRNAIGTEYRRGSPELTTKRNELTSERNTVYVTLCTFEAPRGH